MVKIFEINRLLSSLYRLKNDKNLAKKEYVSQKFADEFFIEITSLFEDIVESSSKLELKQEEGEYIKLTYKGKDFFNLKEKSLNPSKKQFLFLEELLIHLPSFYKEFETYFTDFHIDYLGDVPTYRTIKRITSKKTNFFELFRDMKIFDSDEDGVFIPIEKNHLISFLKNKKFYKKTNYENLNKKKTEIGQIGEELTMKFELNRLKNYEELTERITQISELDDSAGFDILSFENGTSNKEEHDRRIEVKATTDSEPHFYFSINEIEISSYWKSKYWIYLWTDVLKENPKLRKIQNPYEKIIEKNKEKLVPTSYFINKNLIENIEGQEIIEGVEI